jgi:hypothetical protein
MKMILWGFTEIPKDTLILVTFFLNKSVAYPALHLIELTCNSTTGHMRFTYWTTKDTDTN